MLVGLAPASLQYMPIASSRCADRSTMASRQFSCFKAGHALNAGNPTATDLPAPTTDRPSHWQDVRLAFEALHSVYEVGGPSEQHAECLLAALGAGSLSRMLSFWCLRDTFAMLPWCIHKAMASLIMHSCCKVPHWLLLRGSQQDALCRPLMALMTVPVIMQELKLSTLTWHLLPRVGQLLVDLAALLGAADHIDFYQRDLGPSLTPAVSQQLPRPGGNSCSQSLQAASRHELVIVL